MRRLLKFIPLILVIIAIVLLTFQDTKGTVNLSEAFKNGLIVIFDRLGMDALTGRIDSTIAIRRLGHVIEYFALGLAATICVRRKRYALLICVCVSVADQVIKIFVPGRHFDLNDLAFDAAGYVAGILLGGVLAWFGRRRNL